MPGFEIGDEYNRAHSAKVEGHYAEALQIWDDLIARSPTALHFQGRGGVRLVAGDLGAQRMTWSGLANSLDRINPTCHLSE